MKRRIILLTLFLLLIAAIALYYVKSHTKTVYEIEGKLYYGRITSCSVHKIRKIGTATPSNTNILNVPGRWLGIWNERQYDKSVVVISRGGNVTLYPVTFLRDDEGIPIYSSVSYEDNVYVDVYFTTNFSNSNWTQVNRFLIENGREGYKYTAFYNLGWYMFMPEPKQGLNTGAFDKVFVHVMPQNVVGKTVIVAKVLTPSGYILISNNTYPASGSFRILIDTNEEFSEIYLASYFNGFIKTEFRYNVDTGQESFVNH